MVAYINAQLILGYGISNSLFLLDKINGKCLQIEIKQSKPQSNAKNTGFIFF